MVALMITIHLLSIFRDEIGDAEAVRKTLHVVMGTITLSFPWLFADPMPVLVLTVISSIFIMLLKVSNLKQWSSVICAKGRNSIGEICFPLAVGLTFILSGGNKVLYVVPILLLTFADAASALIGKRFGRMKYSTGDGTKTLEGSLAFSAVAFLYTFPICCLSGLGMAESLTIASILSLLAMMFEGVAWSGLDNLFVPLGAFLVLKTHIGLPESMLILRLGLLLLLSLIVLVSRRNTTLNGSGIIASALFCYLSYTIGGITWAVMPVILYLSYRFLLPARFRDLQNAHSVYGVGSVGSAAVVWLLIANLNHSESFIVPYALTFAAHAAIISTAHLRFTNFNRVKLLALLYAILKAWCLICIPLILIKPSAHILVLTIFLAPFCIGIPTFLFYVSNAHRGASFNLPSRWWKQASFVALGSAIGLVILHAI